MALRASGVYLVQALGVTLAGRIPGVLDRQATLAATLDWSHDLLADDERVASSGELVYYQRQHARPAAWAAPGFENNCWPDRIEPPAREQAGNTRPRHGPAPSLADQYRNPPRVNRPSWPVRSAHHDRICITFCDTLSA
jgi:hypothetical protein